MNFQELLSRINELDQPMIEEPNEGNAYGQAVQNTPPGEEIKIDGKGTGDIKREEVVAEYYSSNPNSKLKTAQTPTTTPANTVAKSKKTNTEE